MEVQGKIKQIGDVQTFGNNGFRKREVVITTEEQYPQHLMIEFVQDKTDLLNNFLMILRGFVWRNLKNTVLKPTNFKITPKT